MAQRTWEEKAKIIRENHEITVPNYKIELEGKVVVEKRESSSSSRSSSRTTPAIEEKLRLIRELVPSQAEWVALKEWGWHFEGWVIRILIPAETEIKVGLWVPEDEVWVIWGETHGVPIDTFKHGCEKDWVWMFRPMLIGGHNMSYRYHIPFVAMHVVVAYLENVTTTDEWFKLFVERTVVPRGDYELLKEVVKEYR